MMEIIFKQLKELVVLTHNITISLKDSLYVVFPTSTGSQHVQWDKHLSICNQTSVITTTSRVFWRREKSVVPIMAQNDLESSSLVITVL